MTWDVQTIVLLITTLGGLISSIILIYRARADKHKITEESSKIGAEAAAVISATAVALLAPMREEVKTLEGKLQKANNRADHLSRQLETTTADLRDATKQLNLARDRIDDLEGQVESLLVRLQEGGKS